ncbi:MAG TPA: hypothetical protein PLQ71_10500 [Nitrospira sp.]|nr:hypothetical protein [Nitrospira sp.]
MAWTYKKAVIIDDALGPPTAGSVSSEDKDAWFDFVLNNHDAQDQLMAAYENLKQARIQDLLGILMASTDHIQDLWKRHQKSELPKGGLETLFATECLNRQASSEQAVLIREFLNKEIGQENVLEFYDLPSAQKALTQADVAFVDFFLDKNDLGPDDALARIREHKDVLRKPSLLFFMSSRADIETQQRVREEIHMRSAFFEVMDKHDITDDFLREKLGRKVIDFEANQALERVVRTLAESMKAAATELEEATETLEIHDLTLLNLARLEAEGESLPEYLTWLFSEYVAAKARRNSQGHDLVALNPTQVGFTGQLRQSRVLFELFSEIVFAPGRNQDNPLHFGEVLQSHKKPNEYLLLITPACDFARCEGDLEVLCVLGEAVPFDDLKSHASRRLYGKAGSVLCHLRVHTEKDTDVAKYSLVTWDTKSAFTKPMSVLKGGEYARIQIMNELFAQEVKEEALRSLGRVGTQINPPPAVSLKATARWKVGNGNEPQVVSTPEEEFLAALVMYSERPVLGKDNPVAGPLIVLSDAFRFWLKRQIEMSVEDKAEDPKLLKCISDLDQGHFQAKPSFQFKQNDLSIQIRPVNEKLEDKLAAYLEITLWIDP